MRSLLVVGLLVWCGLTVAAAGPAGAVASETAPSRDEIVAVEQSIYNRLLRFRVETPVDILGLPRGIYLDGYGAVFTAEFGVIQTPGISPFRPPLTKQEIAQIRAAKERRLPEVRDLMRQMLVDAAATLDRVPDQERIVLGFVLFYNAWEDRGRMPRMITMQAEKGALVGVAANRTPRASLSSIVQVKEE